MNPSKKRNLDSAACVSGGTNAANSAASSSGSGQDDDSDFVQVCSPPPRKKIHEKGGGGLAPMDVNDDDCDDDDDDDLVVVSSNLVNPVVAFPHGRRDCGMFPFTITTAEQYCPKCYCHLCNEPVSACSSWAQHCRWEPVAVNRDPPISSFTGEATAVFSPTVLAATLLSAGAAAFLRNRLDGGRRQGGYPASMLNGYYDDQEEDYGQMYPASSQRDRGPSSRRGGGHKERTASQKRITEVLAEKLSLMVKITDSVEKDDIINQQMSDDIYLSSILPKSGWSPFLGYPTPVTQNLKMEGDVKELRLHNSFFVEGVRIGWPFSTILTPQRQMAIHIIKALKRRLHVVLESPTGTGKSAAILCSVLAWQRYHSKRNEAKKRQPIDVLSGEMEDMEQAISASMFPKVDVATTERGKVKTEDADSNVDDDPQVPTIIYCSRTHSQVAQMVASLAKTPYRPRMTILGSRQRLCINDDLRNKNGKKVSNSFLSQGCRDRKMQTDKERRKDFKSNNYDDDNPFPFSFGDDVLIDFGEEITSAGHADTSGQQQPEDTLGGQSQNNARRRKNKPTCPHYQQLTTFRAVRAIKERFIKSSEDINSCCKGGEHSKLGIMDIEDLVEFGKNPYRESGIALYREPSNKGSFGIVLEGRIGGGCQVASLRPGEVAAKDGRIQKGDWIQAINGISTKSWTLDQIRNRIVNLSKDPLILTVQRSEAPVSNDKDETNGDVAYSDHALCPYYLSRALIPSANLIFAPYNYVLDPAIRQTLNLDLKGSVVVLDEAHNIEDILCESGSGDFGEIDLCNLLVFLTRYSNNKTSSGRNPSDSESEFKLTLTDGVEQELSSVAHELLLFIENVLNHMRAERKKFEKGPALDHIKREHDRFRLPDDHSVEVSYSGPSGFGIKGQAVGCRPKLEELGITSSECNRLSDMATSLQKHLFGGENEVAEGDQTNEAVMTDLIDFMGKFELAAKHPEHFYLAFNMKPNGNIDFSTGMEEKEYAKLIANQRWRKHPRPLPFVSPRTELHPNMPLRACNHEPCASRNDRGYFVENAHSPKRHGEMCNGDRPRWECNIVLRLLSSGVLMSKLSSQCRSVILASGSLAPLPSLCAELNLYAPKAASTATMTSTPTMKPLSQSSMASHKTNVVNLLSPATQSTPVDLTSSHCSPDNQKPKELIGRLQVKPSPLEADHVVNLKRQLLACAIGHFPDGKPLTVSYSNYKEESFFPRLGNALASVIEAVPFGGVLVFVPSYSFLNKCIACWNPTSSQQQQQYSSRSSSEQSSGCPQIWTRLLQSKSKVIVEPTGSNQDKFEEARDEYREQVRLERKCILLAVFRGKMSEGISFNDDNARAVICIGLPFPNSFDRNIKAKKVYNDEQRKICKNTSLLPGNEWYTQQAYRAIAQALGRCIRHGADYGTVILMDSRHCEDGSPNDGIPSCHRNLPKWMRHSMRTLSMRTSGGVGLDPISGGYPGLAQELRSFFRQAPLYSESILSQWRLDLENSQKKCLEDGQRTFDSATGQWQICSAADEKSVIGGTGGNVKADGTMV